MSSEDRMRRLGLGHLLDKPPAEQGRAALELHSKLRADWELKKASLSPSSHPPKPDDGQPMKSPEEMTVKEWAEYAKSLGPGTFRFVNKRKSQ